MENLHTHCAVFGPPGPPSGCGGGGCQCLLQTCHLSHRRYRLREKKNVTVKQEITGPRFTEEEEEPSEEKVLSFGEKRRQLQK